MQIKKKTGTPGIRIFIQHCPGSSNQHKAREKRRQNGKRVNKKKHIIIIGRWYVCKNIQSKPLELAEFGKLSIFQIDICKNQLYLHIPGTNDPNLRMISLTITLDINDT